MTHAERTQTTVVEAAIVVAVCFGWFILLSLHSMVAGFPSGGGFSDASVLLTVAIELVCTAMALAVLRYRGYAIASLLPRPTWAETFIGLWLFVVVWVLELLVSTLLYSPGVDEPVQEMIRASTVTVPVGILVSVINGAFEEVFLLGFLQRGLRAHGLSISLGVMMLVRVLYHLYQGPTGATLMLAYGALVGLFYARFQRLWPVVLVHMLFDAYAFLV